MAERLLCANSGHSKIFILEKIFSLKFGERKKGGVARLVNLTANKDAGVINGSGWTMRYGFMDSYLRISIYTPFSADSCNARNREFK
jgi:hypothetical protein